MCMGEGFSQRKPCAPHPKPEPSHQPEPASQPSQPFSSACLRLRLLALPCPSPPAPTTFTPTYSRPPPTLERGAYTAPLRVIRSPPRASIDPRCAVAVGDAGRRMPKDTTKTTKRRAAEKQEKGTKTRGKKDPKAPKRALSAYMFFSQDWRERIKAENPDAGFGASLARCRRRLGGSEANQTRFPIGEIGKLLGAKWKELDDEEKKPYIDQAAADKARAEQEKSEYDGGKKADSAGSGGDDDDE
ncbi:hypothetical protein ACG7TL_007591 [Trametes sanguinea]